MNFKRIKLELGWRDVSEEDNDLGEERRRKGEKEGHIEIMMVVTVENNSPFSHTEPLSVPQGTFIVPR